MRNKILLSLFSYLVIGIWAASPVSAAYPNQPYLCGENCQYDSDGCASGLYCNTSTDRCGLRYYTCSGATCSSSYSWDTSSPCEYPSNRCTDPGTTRTASWSSWSTCSVSCGIGTEERTCNCGSQNTCPVSCSNPTASCNADDTRSCCVSQAPTHRPTVTSVVRAGCESPPEITITWTFSDDGSGCGKAWGYVCGGNDNSFTIRRNGTAIRSDISTSTRSLTLAISDYGTFNFTVCAENGYDDYCSTNYSATISPPPCTVDSQNPTSIGCVQTIPNLHAETGDSCTQQVQIGVDSSSPFTSPWACTSSWVNSSINYTCNPTTGTYYWGARGRSAYDPETCSTPSNPSPLYSFNLDNTGPAVPGVSANSYSSATDTVTFNWADSNDNGCASCTGRACNYWIQGQWLPFLNPTPTWFVNNNPDDFMTDDNTTSSFSVSNACVSRAGATARFLVRQARDNFDNVSADKGQTWSLGSTITCPTPTLYPTVHFEGDIQQRISNTCSILDESAPFPEPTIQIEPQVPLCVTPVCASSKEAGKWHYECNVTFDNQHCYYPDPTQNLVLQANTIDYDTAVWGDDPSAGNVCDSSTTDTVPVDVSDPAPDTTIDQDAIFIFNQDNWVKTEESSYMTNDTSSVNNNSVPAEVMPYGPFDDGEPYFVQGDNAGVIQGLHVSGDYRYSTVNNWYDEDYRAGLNRYNIIQFVEYVKSKKDYTAITDPGQVNGSGLFLIEGNAVINDANKSVFNGRNVVLAVTGTVEFDLTDFVPTGSFAVVADTIHFYRGGQMAAEVEGIFISKHMDTGTTTDQGLHIKGNLVSILSSTFDRHWVDARKPSVYIQYDPTEYISVLPYLSISTYDWRLTE